ncbi:HAD hydrolase-like protein [Lacticaseibacillus pantheris]|uniref:HAD hydrolase-like protein n=1 Tax=Lacticaseibacillus pantheris TaxID=171523 RepID=UPI003F7186FB
MRYDKQYDERNGDKYVTDKTLFFDFDGTIADSERGIVDSIKYMVHERQMRPLTDAQYRTWIGPSLTYSINQFYPELDAAAVDRAIESYRVYYEARGIFEADLYAGITDSCERSAIKAFAPRLRRPNRKPWWPDWWTTLTWVRSSTGCMAPRWTNIPA